MTIKTPSYKEYLFIGPETTINKKYIKSFFKDSSHKLKIYGNGEEELNCRDYKLPEYSRVIVEAHGTHPISFLEAQGIDTSIHKPAFDNHMMKLCGSGFAITHTLLNKISDNKPVNVELFSCTGGKANQDVNQLASESSITTFISEYQNSTTHLDRYYFLSSPAWDNQDNPFIRFAHYINLNVAHVGFSFNLDGNTQNFFSNSLDVISTYDVLSGNKILKWKSEELERFYKFCHAIKDQSSIEIKKQISELDTYDIQPIDIHEYWGALLISAADVGNIELIKKLVAEGVDVNFKINGSGASALFAASSRGNNNVVKFLLEHKDVEVNIKDDFGLTPLYIATQESRGEAVNYLLSHKDIDVNAVDDTIYSEHHGTALNIAIFIDSNKMVESLLSAGAFPYDNIMKSESEEIRNNIILFKKDPAEYIFNHNNNLEHAFRGLNALVSLNEEVIKQGFEEPELHKFLPKILDAIHCIQSFEFSSYTDLLKLCGNVESSEF